MNHSLADIRRRALWGLALALLVAAAMPPAAGAQTFGQNKVQYKRFAFRSISSPHFDVYFYEGGDSLALRVLDLAEKANLKLSRDLGHLLAAKVPIILYNSHHDFAQTNVILELLDDGTGGFTELLRNRVVIPFTGSYEDLRHVVVHELAHAFMFDMLYGGGLAQLVLGRGYFAVPLWFAEGLAEYESLGWESNAEMFVRDGTLGGYLEPLPYAGGYLVYKQGQGALRYLVERHGRDQLRDLLQKLRFHRNFERAFQTSLGTSTERFSEDYQNWLRRMYWPSIRDKSSPEVFARRLTDHRRDRSNLNTAAAISPTGDRIAYLSDRQQFTDLYVMSSLDGRVLRRVVRGQRNVAFENIPSLRSSLTWSADGERLAFIAESQSRDVLYVTDVTSGRVVRKHKLPLDAAAFPAWRPLSDEIAVVGVKDGRSDLYVVGRDGSVRRLTDDTWDEKEPSWAPDGKSLVFSSDRGRSVALTAEKRPGGFGGYGIWTIDVASGAVAPVLDTGGDDTQPVWSPDGRRLAFVTDRGGARNLYLMERRDSSFTQLTDLVGGIFSLSWSRENDRLVFSAFNEGGFDIFIAKEPLSIDTVIARLREQRPGATLTWQEMMGPAPLAAFPVPPGGAGALAPAWPDSVLPPGPLALAPRPGVADSLRGGLPPVGLGGPYAPGDTLRPVGLVTVIDAARESAPFALPDSLLRQEPEPYRTQFATDFAGGGFQYTSAYGFAGSSQFALSDFLGNHRIYLATDLFTSSLSETNLLAVYNYLPRRTDYGVGAFHFKSYFYSRTTTLGEQFAQARYFSERNVGAMGMLSHPLSRFQRLDLTLTGMMVERILYSDDAFGAPAGTERRSVLAPNLSFVQDNVLYGYYGPVNGSRWLLAVSPALPVFPKSLSYQTVVGDYRHYWNLGLDYQFATRLVAMASFGRDQQAFQIGGSSTVRGFDDFELVSPRMGFANLEFRFPFINALGVLGPLPLGFFNLRGAVFLDNALVVQPGNATRFTALDPDGSRRLRDLKTAFGFGVRSLVFFAILKLDVAWRTDLQYTSRPIYHFSIGPEF
jgi:Tol biopolymer transport system component